MNRPDAPLVSVILPTYNRARVLPRAIRSVLNQTFSDLELIIVDDGSTDDTETVVRLFCDPRILYVRRERNEGVLPARNLGIRRARGSFIAFQDSDDEWLSEKLERQLHLLSTSGDDVGAVGCGRLNHSRRGVQTVLPISRGWVFEDILAGRAKGCGTPLLVVRRFASEPDIFFDERFPALGERDYLMRIAARRRVEFVDEPLVRVYRDGGSHVANPWNAAGAYKLYIEKYWDLLKDRPRVLSYYHACIAKEVAALGRMKEARHELRLALQLRGGGFRRYVWLIFAFLGRRLFRLLLRLLPVRPPSASPRPCLSFGGRGD